jgi:hypothetical protein
VTRTQMTRVRAIREELHRLFHLLASGGAPSAAVLAPLNARLASLAPKRQLSSGESGVVWVGQMIRAECWVLCCRARLSCWHRGLTAECASAKERGADGCSSTGPVRGAGCGAAWPTAAIARRDGVTISVSGPRAVVRRPVYAGARDGAPS